jgi:benzoyl-CoA reductase/2-hydroxyglutaryl-CoA dehydratase subunit BcrC/BadD/HgdB
MAAQSDEGKHPIRISRSRYCIGEGRRIMVEIKTELPQVFESFAQARQNGFLAMKRIKDNGKGVVGQFCTYTPLEIFMAADLVSVGLCSTNDETIPEAEKVLPSNLSLGHSLFFSQTEQKSSNFVTIHLSFLHILS